MHFSSNYETGIRVAQHAGILPFAANSCKVEKSRRSVFVSAVVLKYDFNLHIAVKTIVGSMPRLA